MNNKNLKVVVLVSAINLWLTDRQQSKINGLAEHIENINQRLSKLEKQVTKLEYNPAIRRAKREELKKIGVFPRN